MPTVFAQDKPAGTTRIHCPACSRRDVSAQIIEHSEKVTQYVVVEMGTHTTWWVVCSECKARLFSKVPGPELERRTPDELVGVVVTRVGGVRQFWAVASVLLGLLPLVGLVIGIIAYVVNRKSPGWPKLASKIGLGLGLASIPLIILMAVLFPKGF